MTTTGAGATFAGRRRLWCANNHAVGWLRQLVARDSIRDEDRRESAWRRRGGRRECRGRTAPARGRGIRNAGAETRVRTPAIVVRNPVPEDSPEMTLAEQNHPVQALAANRSDHAFAKRVRLR